MVKYHLVLFYSEGPPNDNGKDLSHCRDIILKEANPYFDRITFYTPQILKDMGYGWYVKERNKGLVRMNPGMNNIGNCSWRPLIMLLELEKMAEGDILLYRDSNPDKKKRNGTLLNYNNIQFIINDCLDTCQFDFFVPREGGDKKLLYSTKSNVLRELGDNHPFSYQFPNLFSGLLTIARKSPVSLELLNEWKQACEKEEWIDGEKYGEQHTGFKWQCPEQSILGVIISKWVRNKKHNIPLKYPFITFGGGQLFNKSLYHNYKYLEHL